MPDARQRPDARSEVGGAEHGRDAAGDPDDLNKKAVRENAMSTLSNMAFNRYRLDDIVAASPFTGLFYSPDNGANWTDLSRLLPNPLPPIASLSIDPLAIYVAPEGRSVMRIRGYQLAR